MTRPSGASFVGLSLTVLFFYMMAPFLVSFLLSAVIAIIANPLYSAARRKLSPGLAAATNGRKPDDARAHCNHLARASLGEPIDAHEWRISYQVVNAVRNPHVSLLRGRAR